jgi:hypothetical protein
MNRGGFSWKRFVGLSAEKSRISRAIGIPLTRTGRQRKFGAALGCVTLGLVVFSLAALSLCRQPKLRYHSRTQSRKTDLHLIDKTLESDNPFAD